MKIPRKISNNTSNLLPPYIRRIPNESSPLPNYERNTPNVRAREYRGCVPLSIVGVVARPLGRNAFRRHRRIIIPRANVRRGQDTVGIVESNEREREERFTEDGEQRQQVVR